MLNRKSRKSKPWKLRNAYTELGKAGNWLVEPIFGFPSNSAFKNIDLTPEIPKGCFQIPQDAVKIWSRAKGGNETILDCLCLYSYWLSLLITYNWFTETWIKWWYRRCRLARIGFPVKSLFLLWKFWWKRPNPQKVKGWCSRWRRWTRNGKQYRLTIYASIRYQ